MILFVCDVHLVVSMVTGGVQKGTAERGDDATGNHQGRR